MAVYFAQLPNGSIKIGHSDDVSKRLVQLEKHYGVPLSLLHTEPGSEPEETAWHDRFAHLRFGRTEQFRPAADLMTAIGRPLLVGANPEAVEVAIPAGERIVVAILKGSPEFKAWLSGISEETLIPVASIFRDALKRWAKDRGLPEGPAI